MEVNTCRDLQALGYTGGCHRPQVYMLAFDPL